VLVLGIALSVLVGVALGLLGGGGSILTVPILVYVLRLPAHQAIATSLLVVGTTSLAALVPHALAGRVRWRTGLTFGLAGMLGAYGAGRVARFIPPTVLMMMFGAMMLITAVAMLRGRKSATLPSAALGAGGSGASEIGGVVSGATERVSADGAGARDALPTGKVLLEGLVVGVVTGLVGAGGGFLVVPALVLLGGLSMDVAVGTSLVVIAMKSFAGFAGYLESTPIDWRLASMVTGAAVIGSVIGGSLVGRLAPDRLRRGFALFIVAMAVFTVYTTTRQLF